MAELVFEATQEADGGYLAECLTENIFTQADPWEELRANVVDSSPTHHSIDCPSPTESACISCAETKS